MTSFLYSLEKVDVIRTNAHEILAGWIIGQYYISISKRESDAYYKDIHQRWYGES